MFQNSAEFNNKAYADGLHNTTHARRLRRKAGKVNFDVSKVGPFLEETYRAMLLTEGADIPVFHITAMIRALTENNLPPTPAFITASYNQILTANLIRNDAVELLSQEDLAKRAAGACLFDLSAGISLVTAAVQEAHFSSLTWGEIQAHVAMDTFPSPEKIYDIVQHRKRIRAILEENQSNYDAVIAWQIEQIAKELEHSEFRSQFIEPIQEPTFVYLGALLGRESYQGIYPQVMMYLSSKLTSTYN